MGNQYTSEIDVNSLIGNKYGMLKVLGIIFNCLNKNIVIQIKDLRNRSYKSKYISNLLGVSKSSCQHVIKR
jgi:hypothetical protein